MVPNGFMNQGRNVKAAYRRLARLVGRKCSQGPYDGFTAALINLTYNDDWSRDARGKIVFANPDCRKESVAVLRKMDNCAVAVINAANEFTTTPPNIPAQAGGFGLERGLGQLKRLMGKYKEEYSGFSQDDYDYRGHEPFSKALPLIN